VNASAITIIGLALQAAVIAVGALVAYFVVRLRADIATLENTMLRELQKYVTAEDCRELRAQHPRNPAPQET
jgi:hypothetical protein